MKTIRIYFKIVVYQVVLMTMLLSVVNILQNEGIDLDVPSETGAVVYYDGHFWEGASRYRVKNVIEVPINNSSVTDYINRNHVLQYRNDTSLEQKVIYSYSKTIGHTISAKVTFPIKIVEVELGYIVNEAISTTYTAEVRVSREKMIDVYTYDIREGYSKLENAQTLQWFNWVWKDQVYLGKSTYWIYDIQGIRIDAVESEIG